MLEIFRCPNARVLCDKLNELFPNSFEIRNREIYLLSEKSIWKIKVSNDIKLCSIDEDKEHIIFIDKANHFLNINRPDVTFEKTVSANTFDRVIGLITYYTVYNGNDIIMSPYGYMTQTLNDKIYGLNGCGDPLFLPSGTRYVHNSSNLTTYNLSGKYGNSIELSPLYIGCCKMLNVYVGNNPSNCGFELTIDSKTFTYIGRNVWYGV